MELSEHITEYLEQLRTRLLAKKWRLATAESCTGGEISARITDIPGSSEWFECAFVTYSNAAKQRMLGVSDQTLSDFGAVSEPVVREMAEGALMLSCANVSVAVSGIAGPGGGTNNKPLGMVCFGVATVDNLCAAQKHYFNGDRQSIRFQSVLTAIQILLKFF